MCICPCVSVLPCVSVHLTNSESVSADGVPYPSRLNIVGRNLKNDRDNLRKSGRFPSQISGNLGIGNFSNVNVCLRELRIPNELCKNESTLVGVERFIKIIKIKNYQYVLIWSLKIVSVFHHGLENDMVFG